MDQLIIIKEPGQHRWEWFTTRDAQLKERSFTHDEENVLKAVKDFLAAE